MLRHIDDAQLSIPFANPVKAQLTGDNTCTALGIAACGPSPVLGLCRLLVEAAVDPDRPLHVYRDGMLALTVANIGIGARLIVKTAGNGALRFALDNTCRGAGASPIASFDRAGGQRPSRAPVEQVAP